MSRRRRHFNPFTPNAVNLPVGEPALVRLLILRALFPLGCTSRFLGELCFENDGIATFLGLDSQQDTYDRKAVFARLQKAFTEAEESADTAWQYSQTLADNLGSLQALVGLNEIESRLLVFVVLMHSEYLLSQVCCNWLDDLSTQSAFTVLAALLGVDKEDIVAALSSKGRLVRCGLLSVEPGSTHSLLRRIDLLSESFSDRLMSPVSSPEDFLLGAVKPGKLPTLGVGDYRHIQRQYSLTEQYLRNVLDQKKPGVNILIHGDPGTGKSELVRLLARQLDAGLLEVASEDEQGESFVGKTRLRVYKAAQQFFASQRTLILFDEIQDVFDDGGVFGRSTAQLRKAEINTLLEENPLPTFWLSNDICSMDNAFIRRFDIVVELDVPPLGRRNEILQDALADLPVTADAVQRFARHAHLSPAVVNRAAAVVRMVSGSMPTQDVPVALETLFNQTLSAQGYAQIEKVAANALPAFYDTRFVNADVDLSRLMEGVRQNPSARICLYGPPGTGKSAFAQWLAEQLQRPFHNRKLSDILSMFVGGTEKNLKRAFHDAEQDNAVLLLDEVDSFLQDRRQAQRSWEVTQVNEMLVQMEAFNGVFIASTNLMDNLDQAALRRFDLKIRLDYLMPDQAWSLFLAQCQSMQFSVMKDELQAKVHALRLLTPGDFAAVQRRHRFHPVTDAHALVDSLREECAVKEGGNSRRIGFV